VVHSDQAGVLESSAQGDHIDEQGESS
jgi:hypothetical protein